VEGIPVTLYQKRSGCPVQRCPDARLRWTADRAVDKLGIFHSVPDEFRALAEQEL
jgi:hypothetical protein